MSQPHPPSPPPPSPPPALDPTKIRSLLYRLEPSLAKLSLPSADLIATTCELLLQQLISTTSTSSNNNNNDTTRIISLQDLQRVVAQDQEALSWLQVMMEGLPAEGRRNQQPYVPKPKQRPTQKRKAAGIPLLPKDDGTTTTTTTCKLLKHAAMVSDTAVAKASESISITLDEDDYDD